MLRSWTTRRRRTSNSATTSARDGLSEWPRNFDAWTFVSTTGTGRTVRHLPRSASLTTTRMESFKRSSHPHSSSTPGAGANHPVLGTSLRQRNVCDLQPISEEPTVSLSDTITIRCLIDCLHRLIELRVKNLGYNLQPNYVGLNVKLVLLRKNKKVVIAIACLFVQHVITFSIKFITHIAMYERIAETGTVSKQWNDRRHMESFTYTRPNRATIKSTKRTY